MKKLTLGAIALLVLTASAFTLRSERKSQMQAADSSLTTNAAYRDGLFVGRLAAENGNPRLVSKGRWSRTQDRASYAAGYERGYQTVASAASE